MCWSSRVCMSVFKAPLIIAFLLKNKDKSEVHPLFLICSYYVWNMQTWRMKTPHGCSQKMAQASIVTLRRHLVFKGEFWICFWINLKVVVGPKRTSVFVLCLEWSGVHKALRVHLLSVRVGGHSGTSDLGQRLALEDPELITLCLPVPTAPLFTIHLAPFSLLLEWWACLCAQASGCWEQCFRKDLRRACCLALMPAGSWPNGIYGGLCDRVGALCTVLRVSVLMISSASLKNG